MNAITRNDRLALAEAAPLLTFELNGRAVTLHAHETLIEIAQREGVAIAHQPGDVVTLASRRGQVALYAMADDSSPRGAIFVPFCYDEGVINRLTSAVLDPFGKIPAFKYCAINAKLGGSVAPQGSYGGGQALQQQLQQPHNNLTTTSQQQGKVLWH